MSVQTPARQGGHVREALGNEMQNLPTHHKCCGLSSADTMWPAHLLQVPAGQVAAAESLAAISAVQRVQLLGHGCLGDIWQEGVLVLEATHVEKAQCSVRLSMWLTSNTVLGWFTPSAMDFPVCSSEYADDQGFEGVRQGKESGENLSVAPQVGRP